MQSRPFYHPLRYWPESPQSHIRSCQDGTDIFWHTRKAPPARLLPSYHRGLSGFTRSKRSMCTSLTILARNINVSSARSFSMASDGSLCHSRWPVVTTTQSIPWRPSKHQTYVTVCPLYVKNTHPPLLKAELKGIEVTSFSCALTAER